MKMAFQQNHHMQVGHQQLQGGPFPLQFGPALGQNQILQIPQQHMGGMNAQILPPPIDANTVAEPYLALIDSLNYPCLQQRLLTAFEMYSRDAAVIDLLDLDRAPFDVQVCVTQKADEKFAKLCKEIADSVDWDSCDKKVDLDGMCGEVKAMWTEHIREQAIRRGNLFLTAQQIANRAAPRLFWGGSLMAGLVGVLHPASIADQRPIMTAHKPLGLARAHGSSDESYSVEWDAGRFAHNFTLPEIYHKFVSESLTNQLGVHQILSDLEKKRPNGFSSVWVNDEALRGKDNSKSFKDTKLAPQYDRGKLKLVSIEHPLFYKLALKQLKTICPEALLLTYPSVVVSALFELTKWSATNPPSLEKSPQVLSLAVSNEAPQYLKDHLDELRKAIKQVFTPYICESLPQGLWRNMNMVTSAWHKVSFMDLLTPVSAQIKEEFTLCALGIVFDKKAPIPYAPYLVVQYLAWVTTPDKSAISSMLTDQRVTRLKNKHGKVNNKPCGHHCYIPAQAAIALRAAGHKYSVETRHYGEITCEEKFCEIAMSIYNMCSSIPTRVPNYVHFELVDKIKPTLDIEIPAELRNQETKRSWDLVSTKPLK